MLAVRGTTDGPVMFRGAVTGRDDHRLAEVIPKLLKLIQQLRMDFHLTVWRLEFTELEILGYPYIVQIIQPPFVTIFTD